MSIATQTPIFNFNLAGGASTAGADTAGGGGGEGGAQIDDAPSVQLASPGLARSKKQAFLMGAAVTRDASTMSMMVVVFMVAECGRELACQQVKRIEAMLRVAVVWLLRQAWNSGHLKSYVTELDGVEVKCH